MKNITLSFTIMALASLVLVNTTASVAPRDTGEYDPWLDTNDDGIINIFDLVSLARAYGSTGTPLNKTAALLELQAQVSVLQKTIEARLPQVGMLSIPAAAFASEGEPPLNGDRDNNGGWIDMLSSEYIETYGRFYAPVQLPSGATITRVSSYWWDQGSNYVSCELFRSLYGAGSRQTLATVHSPQSSGPGYGVTSNFTISYATIDNSWQYYIVIRIPPRPIGDPVDYGFQYVIILYEYAT